jgi:hypothetical protein
VTGDRDEEDEIVEVDADLPPRDVDYARVTTLSADLIAAENEVDRATRALRGALDAYRAIAERDLPEAMAAVKLDDFKPTNGTRVRLDRRYVGGKLTDRVGLRWVAAHGGEELIRTAIQVELPVSERAVGREIFELLRAHPAANQFVKLTIEESVHPSTVAAFAKEAVERRLNPPLDRLGVVRRSIARIAGRKLVPVKLSGFERT